MDALSSRKAWRAGEDFSPARSAGYADIRESESPGDDPCLATPRAFPKFGPVFLARFLRQRKPRFCDIADAIQFPLHLRVFGFEHLLVRIGWHINRRGEQNHRSSKRHGQQKM